MIAAKCCMWIAVCLVILEAVQAGVKDQPCPAFCECDTIFGLKEVACGGLTSIPSNIPEDTDILDVSACSLSHIPLKPLMRITGLKIFTFTMTNKDERNYNLTALDLPYLFQIVVVNSMLHFVPRLLPSYITAMSLAYINLGTLKKGSFQRYPNLNQLTVWSCQLSNIQSGAFDDIPDLSYLELNENNLVDGSFTSDLFRKSQALDSLSFFGNNLTKVISDLPGSLTIVDYSSNAIVSLQSKAFESTPKLTYLFLQQNEIKTIEDFAFDGFEERMEKYFNIDLSFNQLSNITNFTFAGLDMVSDLDISRNRIENIETGAFEPLKWIKNLKINDNRLQRLVPEVFQYLPTRTLVFLSGNPWQCDCHLRWLREAVDNANYDIRYPESIECATPKKLSGMLFTNLKPSDFVC